MPSLESYRIVVSIAVVVLLAIIALSVLLFGLSWPSIATAIIVGILAVIGGWLYLKWSRIVTNVSKNEPDSTRLRRVRHEVKRYRD